MNSIPSEPRHGATPADSTPRPVMLVLTVLSEPALATLATHFDVIDAPDDARRAAAIAGRAGDIEVVLTIGTVGITPAEIDAMPRLRLIETLGVGYERVPVDHAKARGIAIANGAGTNAPCVADHAMALLLATVRHVPQFDRACRAGVWRTKLAPQPIVCGKRLGLLGFGAIGQEIAKRAAGFDIEVACCTRTRRDDVPHRWFATAAELAAWSDYLIVATPGGAGTHHLVDAAVLAALGPDGFLVNIARGSVVDTAALVAALKAGRLKGAGLDVYESEPAPPEDLFEFDNVVLTPHVAGTSPESVTAMLTRAIDNALQVFAGRPPVSPV